MQDRRLEEQCSSTYIASFGNSVLIPLQPTAKRTRGQKKQDENASEPDDNRGSPAVDSAAIDNGREVSVYRPRRVCSNIPTANGQESKKNDETR